MDQETKQCQNCKQEFVIEPDDFSFYEKMKVPAPTWCPQCRMIRRFSFLNIWNLYRRNCAKCGKSIITIHSPDKQRTVYCAPCWWADDWDGLEYGMDYDASKPFLAQVKELTEKTPWQALEADYLTLKNADYTNALGHCKDSYLIYWADYCENAYYSTFLNGLKDSLDCYRMEESQLCYECIGCKKCYRTFFSEECTSCADIWFSRNCSGCNNCFGCINLRNKNYYIFNQQYSREEYAKKLKEFQLDSRQALAELRKQVFEFWLKHPQRVYSGNTLNKNVSGEYVYESKNTRDAYVVSGAEDSRYVQFVSIGPTRDCYDYSGWGNGAEKIYECIVAGEGVSNIKYSFECWPNAIDSEYSIYTISPKHVFGCVNLKRKEYCILNKQYTKEEYEELVPKIIKHMEEMPYTDNKGRVYKYGEFFPMEFSPFAYNETVAHKFFPKTKEQVIDEGLSWHEDEKNEYKITMKSIDVPDTIALVEDSIVKEVIKCSVCGDAFRVVQGELNLMKKLELPLPDQCSNCRQKLRLARTNLPILYDRNCAKCGKEIKTAYAPNRPEIIYCEQCYQQEIV